MEQEQNSPHTPLIMIAVIVTLVVVGLLIALNRPQLQQANSIYHKAELMGLLTVLRHVNEQVLPKYSSEGESDVLIEGIAVPLLNGKLRATTGSLERGFDVVYLSKQTHHTAIDFWNMIGRPSKANEPKQIQLQHKEAPMNCHIIYVEAGTSELPMAEQYIVVDDGC